MLESQTANGEKVHQIIVEEIRWRFFYQTPIVVIAGIFTRIYEQEL